MKCCHPIDSEEEKDAGLYIKSCASLWLVTWSTTGLAGISSAFQTPKSFLATSVPHPHSEFIPTLSYTTFAFQPRAQHSSSRTESTPILGLLHVLILAAWPRPDMLLHTTATCTSTRAGSSWCLRSTSKMPQAGKADRIPWKTHIQGTTTVSNSWKHHRGPGTWSRGQAGLTPLGCS